MSISEIGIGLGVGIVIGAMDFSLARSVASIIKSASARAVQAVILGGFIVRLGLITAVLWLLSISSGINFVAVCIGLTGTFTALTLGQAIKAKTIKAKKK
jgi:succinate-acetate transporter protein